MAPERGEGLKTIGDSLQTEIRRNCDPRIDSKIVTPGNCSLSRGTGGGCLKTHDTVGMPPSMSQKSIAEYLQLQRERYLRRPGRQARSVLLDECEAVSGLERRHSIKVPGAQWPAAPAEQRQASNAARRFTAGGCPSSGNPAGGRTALRQAPAHRAS